MRRYAIPTVPRETELQIAQWAQLGYDNPRVEQFKHGDHLNLLDDGSYSANIVGFVLVGKFGDPDTAHQQLLQVEGRFWELLGLTTEQIQPLDDFAADQDYGDIGTDTIIHDLFNVLHLEAHTCEAGAWSIGDQSLDSGAVVLLPVSDQAKEWLAEAADPRNRELRQVRINNMETCREGCEEMRLCTNNNGDLAIFVHYHAVNEQTLNLGIWWLTRMLNLFMPERLKELKRRRAA